MSLSIYTCLPLHCAYFCTRTAANGPVFGLTAAVESLKLVWRRWPVPTCDSSSFAFLNIFCRRSSLTWPSLHIQTSNTAQHKQKATSHHQLGAQLHTHTHPPTSPPSGELAGQPRSSLAWRTLSTAECLHRRWRRACLPFVCGISTQWWGGSIMLD